MKQIRIILSIASAAVICCGHINAQVVEPDSHGDYIHTLPDYDSLHIIPKSGGKNAVAHLQYKNREGNIATTSVFYFDGIGRQTETILVGASPSGNDIVELQEYDHVGRIGNKWLPCALSTQNGNYHCESFLRTEAVTSNGGDAEPYSYPVYEESMLGRVLEEYGSGYAWHNGGKKVKTELLTNNNTDPLLSVRNIQPTSTSGFSVSCTYPNGSLQAQRITNEDGDITITFKDRQGRLVLSRRVMQYGDGSLDTYYVYDGIGNLCLVLPPKASTQLTTGQISSSLLNKEAYIYNYDTHNWMVSKKMPDTDIVYMAYDKADRLILSQDGVQRTKGLCTFHVYDAYGRECLMGECSNTINSGGSASADYVLCTYTGNGTYMGYTLSGITLSNPTILAVNYYDSYEFLNNDSLVYVSDPDYGVMHACPRGLLTGMVSARLGDTIAYDYTTIYYDQYSREIQRHSTNHLGGYEHTYQTYDFVGNLLSRKMLHTATGKQSVGQRYDYTYDNEGRPLKTTHYFRGHSIILSDKEYDNLGRLAAEKRNGNNMLRTNYAYNVRSWPTSISGQLFSETLAYNDLSGTATARFGGDVAALVTSYGGNGQTSVSDTYYFAYDSANRLQDADYLKDGVNGTFNTHYTYDENGNITSLTRQGLTATGVSAMMDNLSLTYDGNRLTKVTNSSPATNTYNNMHFLDGVDETSEYSYNANGCMTKDKNKGVLSVRYNQLSLPSYIKTKKGPSEKITYNIRGEKLQIFRNMSIDPPRPWLDSITPATPHVYPVIEQPDMSSLQDFVVNPAIGEIVPFPTIDYCGSVVYNNNQLQYVLVEGGFISFDENTPVYHFYLRDHLGSNRVVTTHTGQVEQRNMFYPYGASRADCWSDSAMVQRWKYSGKELDSFQGLHCYDYGFRWYDPIVCRWTTPDPMREKYYDISAYAFCHGNPINGIDVYGLEPVFSPNGKLLGTTIEGFKGNVYIYYGNENIDFNKASVKDFAKLDVYSYSQYKGLANSSFVEKISGEAMADMWTTIINHFEGSVFFNTMFSLSNLKNRKINFDGSLDANWQTEISNQGDIMITGSGKFDNYEFTVENVASSIISHEWYTHAIERIGFNGNNHSRAYMNTILNVPLWNGTTERYKKFVIGEMYHFMNLERSFRFPIPDMNK